MAGPQAARCWRYIKRWPLRQKGCLYLHTISQENSEGGGGFKQATYSWIIFTWRWVHVPCPWTWTGCWALQPRDVAEGVLLTWGEVMRAIQLWPHFLEHSLLGPWGQMPTFGPLSILHFLLRANEHLKYNKSNWELLIHPSQTCSSPVCLFPVNLQLLKAKI